MTFASFLDAFWVPFGCLLDAFWNPGRPWAPFWQIWQFLWFLERHRREKTIPFGHKISLVDDILAIGFLSFFGVRNFLTFCSFKVHSGSNLGGFLGCPGTLEISLKRWSEHNFHTLEAPFAGMISRLDLMSHFFPNFEISDVFLTPCGEHFGTNMWKNGVWKKIEKGI